METDYIFRDVSGLDVRLEDFDTGTTDLVFEYETGSGETAEVELEELDVDEIVDILDPDSVEGHPHGIDFLENPEGRDPEDALYDLTIHSGKDVISVSGLKKESFLAGYTRPDSFYDRTGRDLEREIVRNFDVEVEDSNGHVISSNNLDRWGSFTGLIQSDDSELYLAEEGARRARLDYDGEGLEDYEGEKLKLYGGLEAEFSGERTTGEFVLDVITYEEV